jgi:hypothetical protein
MYGFFIKYRRRQGETVNLFEAKQKAQGRIGPPNERGNPRKVLAPPKLAGPEKECRL